MSRLPSPYSIVDGENGYNFYTDLNLSYFVYFNQTTNYFSNHPNLNGLVFDFGFECLEDHTICKKDDRVEDTVMSMIHQFFKKNELGMIAYICDGADGKAHLRNRLFKSWFNRHLASTHDRLSVEYPDVHLYGSLIFKSNHPFGDFIKGAFASEFL